MQALSDRQETILALLVHDYTETATPVGSEHLVSKFDLDISPATVRNEMSVLTERNLLQQPHTSAGRVPTERGYRYFVRRLQKDTELPVQTRRLISHQFHQARADIDEWVRLAAAVLAHHSRVAALVTAPRPDRAIFKHLELISTQPRQVLLVLVLVGGDVRQQVLTLAETVSQAKLSESADTITQACLGLDTEATRQLVDSFSDLEQDVTRLVAEVMSRTDALFSGEIHRDGLANVLAQPEFSDSELARNALRLLEERSMLEQVLTKALSSAAIGGVQVVIGGEGFLEELKDCSVVLARYGAPGYATGALGVLGPTRMAYGRSISAVRYVAGLMSELITETLAS